jgi:H+/gluconate symporter-like permease
MNLDVGAILLSLGLLMAIAYRGLPVIVFAPFCALLAAALSGVASAPGSSGSTTSNG